LLTATILCLVAMPGWADVAQLHMEMKGIPDDECLSCHEIKSSTEPESVPSHPAHGIHLHVVENCSDCHHSVDLVKAETQPWQSQVNAEVCYECHQGERTMVEQVLQTTVSAMNGAQKILSDLDTRAPLPVEGDFVGSETCGACHEEIFEFWKAGPHARAMTSPVFEHDWDSSHHAEACLRCHTTAFNPETGEYAEEGVGCEVCHGPMKADHPEELQGHPDFSAPICANCHLDEWGEWRSSVHADAKPKAIECDSCHNPHGQKLLFDNVQDLCGACHSGRSEVFAHSTHANRDIRCSECHMHPAEHGGKTGHTFTVGSGTCIRCHKDEIHKRERIVALGAEVEELRTEGEEDLRRQVGEAKEQIEELSTRSSLRLYVGLLQGSIIGLAVGGFGAWTAARHWREEEEEEDDAEEEKNEDTPE
jgi:predicted CXXCH cytochrome family protein